MRYTLYRSPVAASRNLWYPKGVIELERVLQSAICRDGPDSLAGALARFHEVNNGSFYITVPIDCAEDIEIDDLRWGQFYLETVASKSDERRHAEISTAGETNEAISGLIRSGTHVAIIQLGAANDEQFALLEERRHAGVQCLRINGIAYYVADKRSASDSVLGALADPVAELRFVVRASAMHSLGEDQFLEGSMRNLTFVAASIFDYMGYLLWWPK